MNETPSREAHLNSLARERTRRRDQRIADRLAELIHRGVDPAKDGGSVGTVLVGGGIVSRATYYRHKAEWTWTYLLDELLRHHRPKAAALLAQIREENPSSSGIARTNSVARLAPLIASVTPKADEQDLLIALEEMLIEAEFAPPPTPGAEDRPWDDVWFRLEATTKLLVDRLGVCRPTGKAEWLGAAEVVARLYEFASLPHVRASGQRAFEFHRLDESWIYCLVRSGTSPRDAVRTIDDAWASAHPDFSPYDRALWSTAAQAVLDLRGDERAFVPETGDERRERDEAALVEVLKCTRRSAPTLSRTPVSYPIDETGNVSDVLLAAIRWDWARDSPLIRQLANFVDRATQHGAELHYGNRAHESAAYAWATWTLAASSESSPDAERASEVLLRFTLRQCQTVGREPGGTTFDLRSVPPAVASYLHVAGRIRSSQPNTVDALTDLIERLASVSSTSSWARLPRVHQEAWQRFVDEAPTTFRLRPSSSSIRRLVKILDSLESDFLAGARVEVDDMAALTDASERIAWLTAWASSADWSAPWDTPPTADVGTPFTRPSVTAPDEAERLRHTVRREVGASTAENLSRNTMAVRWAGIG